MIKTRSHLSNVRREVSSPKILHAKLHYQNPVPWKRHSHLPRRATHSIMYFPVSSALDLWTFPSHTDTNLIRSLLHVSNAQRPGRSSRHAGYVIPNYSSQRDKTCVYIEIEIPGVEKEDISVETHGKKLTIMAKRYKGEKKDKEGNEVKPSVTYWFQTRLSEKTNLDGIKAECRGLGVLRLFVPLKEEEHRKISVS